MLLQSTIITRDQRRSWNSVVQCHHNGNKYRIKRERADIQLYAQIERAEEEITNGFYSIYVHS